jgi:hypothetical protein
LNFDAGGGLDQPVPADYDGDGLADIATFRTDSDLEEGQAGWFIQFSEGSSASWTLREPGSSDAPGDYDGDGRFDLAAFDLALSTWRIQSLDENSEEEVITFGRGLTDEVPVTVPLADRLIASSIGRDLTSLVGTARHMARSVARIGELVDRHDARGENIDEA